MAASGGTGLASVSPETARWAAETLGPVPATTELLERALTHKSGGAANYERLEFLGDRLLGAIMAAWLYELFPDDSEGALTRRMARLVSRETCARVARRLGVPRHVRLGIQARTDGGADSDNILGDVMEALIGAAYLEGGLEAAERLVRTAFASEVGLAGEAPKHPKSALQEWAAARGLRAPVYRLAGRTGMDHNPRFRVELVVGGFPPAEAEGASKQEAETLAAAAFLARHAS